MTTDPREAYDELIRQSRDLATLSSCASVLGWDEQTYMPSGGATHRGSQMALLAGLHHERATDPRFADLLESVEGSSLVSTPDSAEAVNVRELRRSYDRRVRLPRALVEELARTTSMAQSEWVAARAASDFARFRPWLEKIVQLKREESACLAGNVGTEQAAGAEGSVYDPLLDEYEPGARSVELVALFDALRRELAPFVAAIAEATVRTTGDCKDPGPSAASVGESILRRGYPLDRQRIFGEAVASTIGFDFRPRPAGHDGPPVLHGDRAGRLPDHHALRRTRLQRRLFRHPPRGRPRALRTGSRPKSTMARRWVRRSRWGSTSRSRGSGRTPSAGADRSGLTVYPMAQRIFHEALADVTLDAFHAAVNRVEPSLIRVQADEATYNLHVILRFELEQALLTGDLPVGDLPAAWNEKYREILGVTPRNDAEGCLQDIHWSAGLIGYFPTYTLGNLYAAQLFATADAELGDLDAAFAQGDFHGLLDWLREKVHRQGRGIAPRS